MKRKPKPKGVRMWGVKDRRTGDFFDASTGRERALTFRLNKHEVTIPGVFIPDKAKARKR